jgi:hemerythrin-like domain-containing protein
MTTVNLVGVHVRQEDRAYGKHDIVEQQQNEFAPEIAEPAAAKDLRAVRMMPKAQMADEPDIYRRRAVAKADGARRRRVGHRPAGSISSRGNTSDYWAFWLYSNTESVMSVTTAIQSATRAIGSMLSGSDSEPEILDTLKQEHEEVADLLKTLVDSESGAERKRLVAKIKSALIPHVEAEQAVLYDALIAVGDKNIQQDGKEGYIEHRLASETLATLETIANATSAEFGATAKVLKELIEHHVQEEERNVWADAKEKFSADQRVTMNQKYLAAKKLVSTLEKKAPAVKKPAVAVMPKIARKKASPKK